MGLVCATATARYTQTEVVDTRRCYYYFFFVNGHVKFLASQWISIGNFFSRLPATAAFLQYVIGTIII